MDSSSLLSGITFLALTGCGDGDKPLPPAAPEVFQIRAHGLNCATHGPTGAPAFTIAPGQYRPTVEGHNAAPSDELPAVTAWTPWVGSTFFYLPPAADSKIERTERGIELTMVLGDGDAVLRAACTIPAN